MSRVPVDVVSSPVDAVLLLEPVVAVILVAGKVAVVFECVLLDVLE